MSIRIGIGLDVFGAGIDANAQTIYNRIIADGGVSNLSRLNFFVKGLKAIYGDLANVPVCYDAHWIGYKLGSGTGATAGQAAAKLYSLTVAGDAVQATAASQPLLLAHNGASSDNYWYGSGVSGNYVSTPNAVANQITGDIEIIAKFRINSLSNSGIILSKWSSNANNTGSYELYYSGGSRFQFYIQRASDGLANNVLSGIFSLTINTDIYIKVNRIASTGTVNFYQSTDGITYNLISTSTLFTGDNIYNSTALVKIGSEFAVDQSNINAKISRATISNSIGGAPVVDFNPATYNASTSQTQWTSSTGEVWTINTGTATTGYKGVLVDRTIVQSDGVDDTITNSTFALSSTGITEYINRKKYTSTAAAGFAVCLELGTNVNSAQGILVDFNDGANVTFNGVRGNIGTNASSFSDTSTNLVLVTAMQDVSQLGINETSYYAINNTPLTRIISGVVDNSTMSSVGLYIMSRNGNTAFANIQLNTLIISNTANNDTTRTATYNLIRSLNNNAF